MVVDDDPHVLCFMTLLLHRRGYRVYSYDSPLHCPHYMAALSPNGSMPARPDIIISDFEMPEVNGLEFMERLYSANCIQGNAAIVTGSRIGGEAANRLDALGVRVLQKPLTAKALYAWVDQFDRSDGFG